MNATDPSELFGGTWERIKDRFVLAAGDNYEVGVAGGEATHTLTADELPVNAYSATFKSASYGSNIFQFLNADSSGNNWNGDTQFMLAAKRRVSATSGVDNTVTIDNLMTGNPISISNSSGGHAHNNMPPYLVAYMWCRVA